MTLIYGNFNLSELLTSQSKGFILPCHLVSGAVFSITSVSSRLRAVYCDIQMCGGRFISRLICQISVKCFYLHRHEAKVFNLPGQKASF